MSDILRDSSSPPARPADGGKGIFIARVLSNKRICREHYRLVLEVDGFPAAAPGQFVQVLCHDAADEAPIGHPLLRRPFSIGGLRREGQRSGIDILNRVIGPGTQWLARLEAGRPVNVIGPLGQPFWIADGRPQALLVGGGVGLPPLIWLAESLAAAGRQTVAFCGARSADLLPLTPDSRVAPAWGDAPIAFTEFSRHGVPVFASTDDGSLGTCGTCVDTFIRFMDTRPQAAQDTVVYTCGPEAMMCAVARVCDERGLPCQVSLERVMACGVGTCQSCVVRVRDDEAADGWRYRLCCSDGPVFDSRLVLWEPLKAQ